MHLTAAGIADKGERHDKLVAIYGHNFKSTTPPELVEHKKNKAKEAARLVKALEIEDTDRHEKEYYEYLAQVKAEEELQAVTEAGEEQAEEAQEAACDWPTHDSELPRLSSLGMAEAKAAFAALGPPLKELPELGLEFARYSLELKLAEHTLTLLVAQLEGAKLRQAKQVPAVQVLDLATPPEYRSAPRRTLIVFVAALLSLLISVVLAFIGESLSKLSSQHQEKLKSIGELMGPRT